MNFWKQLHLKLHFYAVAWHKQPSDDQTIHQNLSIWLGTQITQQNPELGPLHWPLWPKSSEKKGDFEIKSDLFWQNTFLKLWKLKFIIIQFGSIRFWSIFLCFFCARYKVFTVYCTLSQTEKRGLWYQIWFNLTKTIFQFIETQV